MQKRTLKKLLTGVVTFFVSGVIILGIHIYMVTRPKAPDAATRIMARIDIRQAITETDARRITAWLYNQKGVDHVLCNPDSRIVVFTYAPLLANANQLTARLQQSFALPAERIVPTEAEMKSGCPVTAGSFSQKIAVLFKKII